MAPQSTRQQSPSRRDSEHRRDPSGERKGVLPRAPERPHLAQHKTFANQPREEAEDRVAPLEHGCLFPDSSALETPALGHRGRVTELQRSQLTRTKPTHIAGFPSWAAGTRLSWAGTSSGWAQFRNLHGGALTSRACRPERGLQRSAGHRLCGASAETPAAVAGCRGRSPVPSSGRRRRPGGVRRRGAALRRRRARAPRRHPVVNSTNAARPNPNAPL
jgi:hypothetical protein